MRMSNQANNYQQASTHNWKKAHYQDIFTTESNFA